MSCPDTTRAQAAADVRQGFALHAGDDADPDLALLRGDRLYARGLERLAAEGDLEAVDVLAEAIASASRARAAGNERALREAWNAADTALAGAPTGQDGVIGRALRPPTNTDTIE